jgi:hypothetical protein
MKRFTAKIRVKHVNGVYRGPLTGQVFDAWPTTDLNSKKWGFFWETEEYMFAPDEVEVLPNDHN